MLMPAIKKIERMKGAKAPPAGGAFRDRTLPALVGADLCNRRLGLGARLVDRIADNDRGAPRRLRRRDGAPFGRGVTDHVILLGRRCGRSAGCGGRSA